MLFPPGGNGIGEHGHLIAKEGAGFDLQVDLFLPLLQEKVEPAVSMPDFPSDDFRSLLARQNSLP
jgi:hypothetical protein